MFSWVVGRIRRQPVIFVGRTLFWWPCGMVARQSWVVSEWVSWQVGFTHLITHSLSVVVAATPRHRC